MADRRGLGRNYRLLWLSSVVSNFGDGLSIIAYPWLASALTRHPVAIAGVAVASRLPWLLFTLPAGVVTDRYDRRRLILSMDVIRFVLTAVVALVVLAGEGSLNDPADIAAGMAAVPDSAAVGIALLYLAALLLGSAEVLRDNSAQTLMPAIVEPPQLERANGRLWGAEMVMNAFVGPPVAGLLLTVSFALPFFVDAGTFAVAAALLFLLAGDFRPRGRADPAGGGASFRAEMREGFDWLWHHRFLRSMAISLGVLNLLFMATEAANVLFAQEVLGLSAAGFGALGISLAVGGILGSVTGPRVSAALGPGNALFLTVASGTVAPALIAAFPSVPLVFSMLALFSYTGTLWNVVTVSLRQQLIPDNLLGRVNSVYRFFGWGMMPIGTLIGGAIVAIAETTTSRETALRLPFAFAAAAHVVLLVYVVPRLNTSAIEAAKHAAVEAGVGSERQLGDEAAADPR